MVDLMLERLRRLPQREDEVWQGGLIRLPAWIEEPPAPYRPWVALWVSTRTGLVGSSDPVRPDEKSVELVRSAFVASACDEELAGYRPGRVEVRDAALAGQLESWLAGIGIEVARRERLPELDSMMAAMARDLLGGDPPPDALSAPGVTVERMQAFAEAAREFYLATPWRHLTDEDLLRIDAPFVETGLRFATVLGAVGETYGLGFFDSLRGYQALVDAPDPVRVLSRRRAWSLAFGPLPELPPAEADLWEDHGLPVAGPEAYPHAACIGPGKRMRRPSARTLAFLEGLLRALARTTESQLEAGRWEQAVTTADGSVRFKLSSPETLEALREDAVGLSDPVLFDPRAAERMTAHIQRLFQERDFASLEEAVAFGNANLVGREVPTRSGRTPLERAQDLIYDAFEARGRQRTRLARQALELSPDCADAYVLLAEAAPDRWKALELYEQGVAAGERALGRKVFEEEAGRFWGIFETRPYMRARLGLAHCLEVCDRADEALEHYRQILQLDVEDHQGVRYVLIARLLERNEDRVAEGFLKAFAEDHSALWLYAWALVAFRRAGDGAAARRRLAKALAANSRVPRYLLGKRKLPPIPPASYGFGDDSEAVICAMDLGKAWKSTPGALAWLAGSKDLGRRGGS